jgi:hypothetical protein
MGAKEPLYAHSVQLRVDRNRNRNRNRSRSTCRSRSKAVEIKAEAEAEAEAEADTVPSRRVAVMMGVLISGLAVIKISRRRGIPRVTFMSLRPAK